MEIWTLGFKEERVKGNAERRERKGGIYTREGGGTEDKAGL